MSILSYSGGFCGAHPTDTSNFAVHLTHKVAGRAAAAAAAKQLKGGR